MSSKRITRQAGAAVSSPVSKTIKTKIRAMRKGPTQVTKSPGNDLMLDNSSYFQQGAVTSSNLKPGTKLPRSFFDQDTVTLSRALLGTVLCRKVPSTGQIVKGTVVETEAYPGKGDAASHSHKGVPTESSMAMFMDPGTAYVYFTYGMYYCFNISSKDCGGACLIRGLEVHEDYEIMHSLRQPKRKNQSETPSKRKPLKQHELANGPAKLCLAMNITRDLCNKIDMVESEEFWLEVSSDEKYYLQKFEIGESKRVGIDSTPLEARNQLYRFFIKDNASVSNAKFKEENNIPRKRKLT